MNDSNTIHPHDRSALMSSVDFFLDKAECARYKPPHAQTNSRYERFNQVHFTAGDEEQFESSRDTTNSSNDILGVHISLAQNIWNNHQTCVSSLVDWQGYANISAIAEIHTFRYIFHKFKKGIFVRIRDNRLVTFLPFSKASYYNEWGDRIKVDPVAYPHGMLSFLAMVAEETNKAKCAANDAEGQKRIFNPRLVNQNTREWYANNCLVRYEYPLHEGDTNVGLVKNLLEELCERRQVPDIAFFLNRRDFPILMRDGTEPYDHIWDSHIPLVSHAYPAYAPILSMVSQSKHADLAMPTCDDWARVQSYEGKWFPKMCRDYDVDNDNESAYMSWSEKISKAVFRGSSTGYGTTIDDNMRLRAAYLSTKHPSDIDAGITDWNCRPRKIRGQPYLQAIRPSRLPFACIPKLSPREQAAYKYILHIDGHVSAFRLSLELSMRSVILLVDSPWKVWYQDHLQPYVHFVPVKHDMSDLLDQISWCRAHDAACERIAQNARVFFDTFLQKNGILDYMQKLLVDAKAVTGTYLYNTVSVLDAMLTSERSYIEHVQCEYPVYVRSNQVGSATEEASEVTFRERCFGVLEGTQWALRKVFLCHSKQESAEAPGGSINDAPMVWGDILFQHKHHGGTVRACSFAGVSMVAKSTSDARKIREHVHDTYIGLACVNPLLRHVPNFAYTFGSYENAETGEYTIFLERIPGPTLLEYIISEQFSFRVFTLVLTQLCLALHVAQNTCAFVHNDLTPWNIVLWFLPEPMRISYVLGIDDVVVVETSVVPVIIDYGRAHGVVDGIHHGWINMFSVRTYHDVLNVLVSSLADILTRKELPKPDFGNLMRLANSFVGTQYRQPYFTTAKELRTFLKHARKYSELTVDKGDLDRRSPLELIRVIETMREYKYTTSSKNQSGGRLVVTHTSRYPTHPLPQSSAHQATCAAGASNDGKSSRDVLIFSMNRGDSYQIFEYLFCDSFHQKAQTYVRAFRRYIRVIETMVILPNKEQQSLDALRACFVTQTIAPIVNSVGCHMKQFLRAYAEETQKEAGKAVSASLYSLLNDATHLLETSRTELPAVFTNQNETWYVQQPSVAITHVEELPYDADSFLDPARILVLLRAHNRPSEQTTPHMPSLFHADLRNTLLRLLTADGPYRLGDAYRATCTQQFANLFASRGVALINNASMVRTLWFVAQRTLLLDCLWVNKQLGYRSNVEEHADGTSHVVVSQLYNELYNVLQ